MNMLCEAENCWDDYYLQDQMHQSASTSIHVWESEDDFDSSATEFDSVNSSCCSFPTKDIFVSEPLCVPFTKEFLSDFLFPDNAHPAQETHQEIANQSTQFRCENSHRPADPEDGIEESSNRISDLGNYWLYHHREHDVWKEEDQADVCAPIRRNKRFMRTFHQSDPSTKRRTIDDTAQFTCPSKPEPHASGDEPQQSSGPGDVLTVSMEPPSAQCSDLKQPNMSTHCQLKQDISDSSSSKGSSKRSRSNASSYADFEYSTRSSAGRCVEATAKSATTAPEAMPAIHLGTAAATTQLLTECKFLSKRSGFRCPCAPALTTHKRGHLSVSCSNGHQWVWCRACCNCGGTAGDSRGCSHKGHWFERDAFDTGRRNHMRTAHGL